MTERPSIDLNWPAYDALNPTPRQPRGDSPAVAQKKSQLVETTIQKKAMFGTHQEMRTIATAQMQGNELGQLAEVEDILSLSDVDFARKYPGVDQSGRAAYARQYQDLLRLKNDYRSTGDTTKDTAIDTGLMAANMLGGAAVLGGNALDQLFGTTGSVKMSQDLQRFNEWARSGQSQLAQDRREQHQIEADLDTADRAARYDRAKAAAAEDPNASGFDKALGPWLRKSGEAMAETVTNFADDPIMLGSLVPEAVGSMAPTAIGIRAVGTVAALRQLMSSGMSREAAEALLRTETGKKLIQEKSLAAAPATIGITESGSAVNETQQDIMSMPEAELMKSEQYRAMIEADISPADARAQLARNAGSVTGIVGLPGAIAAGRIAARIATNPVRISGANAIREGASDIVRETAEEGLQEGISQLSSNVGVNAIGIDRALDEGVFEGAAQGMLSGAMTAGALQSPGMAADVASSVGSAVGEQAVAAAEARKATVAAQIDATSAVGAPAQAEADQVMLTEGAELLAELAAPSPETGVAGAPEQTTPTQTKAATPAVPSGVDPEVPSLAQVTEEALYLPDEEAAQLGDYFEPISAFRQANPGAMVPATLLIDAAGTMLDDTEAHPALKTMAAVAALQKATAIRRLDSIHSAAALETLPADDPRRERMAKIQQAARTRENSPAIAKAEAYVAAMTPEDVRAVVDFDQLNDPSTSEAVRASIQNTLKTIAEINPEAIRAEDYDLVLNQLGPGKVGEVLKKALTAAKRIVEVFSRADTAKSQIVDEQDVAFEAQAATAPAGTAAPMRRHKPADIVRREIHYADNSDNNLPSLQEHNRLVIAAMNAGRIDDATDQMQRLANFAQTLANKVAAFNQSAESGKGREERFAYEAFGPFGAFMQEGTNGVWTDVNNPRSVALAREALVDAQTAAEILETLAVIYGIEITAPEVPVLHPSIAMARTASSSTGRGRTGTDLLLGTIPDATGKKLAEQAAERDASRVPEVGGVTLPVVNPRAAGHTAKDQKKADQATKMIGRGSAKSSTAAYAKAFGPRANSGIYSPEDVVFVSAEGGRPGRMDPDFTEIGKAIAARATIITDTQADRARSYNKGERQVAEFLTEKGYQETSPGTWTAPVVDTTEIDAALAAIERSKAEKAEAEAEAEAKVAAEKQRKAETAKRARETRKPKAKAAAEGTSTTSAPAHPLRGDAKLVAQIAGISSDHQISELTDEDLARIDPILTRISETLGIDVTKFIKGFVGYHNPNPPHNGAWAWWDNQRRFGFREGVIGIDRTSFENDRFLTAIVTHEVFHILDDMARGDSKFMVSDNRWLTEKGTIHDEIASAMETEPRIAKWFSYAMSYPNGRVRASELFAELGALYTLNREFAERHLPHGSVFIEKALARLGGVQQGTGQVPRGADAATGTGQRTPTGSSPAGTAARNTNGNPRVAPPPVEEGKTPSETWMDWVKDLLVKGVDGFNAFLQGFKSGKNGSILTAQANPVAWLQENLHTLDLSAEQQKALSELLVTRFPEFQEAFDKAARDLMARRKWKADDLGNALTYDNALALNLLVPDGQGGHQIEPRAMAAAFMATMEWMLANAGPQRSLDDDKINEMFGRPRGTSVDSEMRKFARSGVQQQAALETIATKIMQLLDVQPKDEESIRWTQGVFRALAANGIDVLRDTHAQEKNKKTGKLETTNKVETERLIQWETRTYKRADGSFREMTLMKPRAELAEDENFSVLKTLRDPFTWIFLEGREKARHVGEKPSTAKGTQIGNRLARLSRTERKVVQRLQEMPSYLNRPMVELLEQIGDKAFLRLLGYRELSEAERKTMNPDHLDKIDGVNQTLAYDLAALKGYIAEAGQQGGDRFAVPIFFEWEVSSVGRLQQVGPVTPQGSKIARELLTATHASLDLANEDHQRALWLAVAQSLGVKVEKKSFDEITAEVEELVAEDGAYGPAYDLFLELAEGKPMDAAKLEEALAGKEVTHKVLHALETFARANLAMGQAASTDLEVADLMSLAREAALRIQETASEHRADEVTEELASEARDVGVLLDLLGIDYPEGLMSVAPSEAEVLQAQVRLMEIYEEVVQDPVAIDKHKAELSSLMGWLRADDPLGENDARKERAIKHAKKYGNGNETAHYLVQAIEELGEVLTELAPETNRDGLEIQKRALKVLRFGPDTVIKGEGPYAGQTNIQALRSLVPAQSFRTALALEADGKTDGPINAMIHMGVGNFSAEEIARFAKGGLFFTDMPVSLNEYIAIAGGQDLYNDAAAVFEEKLTNWLLSSKNGPEKQRLLQVLRLMSAFNPDFRFEHDENGNVTEMEIGRGLPKNPLTVFLYGSGDAGIAGKLSGVIADSLAEMLTEIAQSGQPMGKHPKMSPQMLQDLTDVLFQGNKQAARDWLSKPTESTMSAWMFENLSNAVLEDFGAMLVESVDQATGGLGGQMKFTQRVSQVQTLVFQDVFDRRLDEAQAAHDKAMGWTSPKDGQRPLLSMEQIRDIFTETMKIAPIYGSDAQSFHIAAPEKAALDKHDVARSFSGSLKTQASYIAPADASVKVSPYLTIGTGDGRMILNIYANGDGSFTTSLPVFDGVEMGLDTVFTASGQINEQVLKGWLEGNPYQMLLEGFDQLMGSFDAKDFAALSESTKKELLRVFNSGLPKDMRSKTVDFSDLEMMRENLEGFAWQATARKRALSRMGMSVDHMASAEVPHFHDGVATVSGDPRDFEGIAQTLNTIYNSELQKVKDEAEDRASARTTAGYAQNPTPGFTRMLKLVGTAVPGHEDVTRVSGKAVMKLLSEDTGASREQRYVIKDLSRISGTPLEEAVFFFGEPDALQALRDERHGSAWPAIELGQSFTGLGEVFIANPAPETLVHEVLHLYTATTLRNHYADPAASPEHVRFAVARLEELMGDVQQLTTVGLDKVDAMALRHLQTELASHQGKGRMDAAIGELISYTLSNQSLIEKGQKTRTYRPLMSFIREGLKAVAKFLGIRIGNPGDTLFSNIRFNARLLATQLTEPTPEAEAATADAQVEQTLQQTYPAGHGATPEDTVRLQNLERSYFRQLTGLLKGMPRRSVENDETRLAISRLRMTGRNAAEHAVAHGFALNPRQARVFEAIHATVSAGIKADQPVSRHLYEAFSHVLKALSPEMIVAAGVADAPRAAEMVAFLTGRRGVRQTADVVTGTKRTDMMATFFALAQVDPDLRRVLEKMKTPKVVELKWTSVDDWVRSLGQLVTNLITRLSLQPRLPSPTLRRELDLLGNTLSEIQGDRRFMAAFTQINEKVELANAYLSRQLDKGSKAATRALEKRAARTNTTAVKTILNATTFLTALGSKEEADNRGRTLTTMLNHTEGWNSLRSALSDLRGLTAQNAPLMRLINPVKARIDQLRQDFREGVPAELSRAFTRKLKREEWKRLHKIARADLMALGLADARALMADPTQAKRMETAALEQIEKLARPLGKGLSRRYKAKARALAAYMVDNSMTSRHLLPNAYAIALLLGEQGGPSPDQVTPELVGAIDRLTSLYAYARLDSDTRATLTELSESQVAGMETLTGFLNVVRQSEIERRDRHGSVNVVAQMNGLKGYVPALLQEGASLKVADPEEHEYLVRRGYVKIGTYAGDPRAGRGAPRAYYQSSVGGKAQFRQGVAQTVHETWQGVDSRTGAPVGEHAGLMTGRSAQRVARQAYRDSGQNDGVPAAEYLRPVFGANGEVTAYVRTMDPARLDKLPRDEHLGRMLGVWMGRILEETVAEDTNKELVTTMKALWDEAVATGDPAEIKQFVNVADPEQKDAVIRDAWNTLGWRIKEEITEQFGEKNLFMVRRDQVEDTIGFRAASVTDPWTGVSRWSETSQKHVREALELFGPSTFVWLKKAENLVHDAVSYAKTTIIIRSVVVGVGNFLSNFLHMSLAGMSIVDIAVKSREKFSEITEYVKNREEIQRLQVQAAALALDPKAQAPLAARVQMLEEANKRLSIAPLLEAGEFSTISENLTEADVAIREGRWADYMEKAVEKLPDWASTGAKNLLITKDTALFQGLNRMVQYGDFVAKAALYEHLIEKKGMEKQAALDKIFEEFVPYNRLPGRGRDFLESMGLMWFWNYKMRIMKVMANTLRERPLTALMMVGGVGPSTGIDTVWDGSLAGNIADGSVWFSVGPEMGFNAPGLHPVFSMS